MHDAIIEFSTAPVTRDSQVGSVMLCACVSVCAPGCFTCDSGDDCRQCKSIGYAPAGTDPPYPCERNILTLHVMNRRPSVDST